MPHAAQAGPEGLGCIRRCVGVAESCAYPGLPRGAYPKPPGQNYRDSGVSAAVWEGLDARHIRLSPGASLPPKRCRQDRRVSGVSAAV